MVAAHGSATHRLWWFHPVRLTMSVEAMRSCMGSAGDIAAVFRFNAPTSLCDYSLVACYNFFLRFDVTPTVQG